MNALKTVIASDAFLLVIMIFNCFQEPVNGEECKSVDDSHCHCRTDSGYEVNLSPLASQQ